MVRREWLLATLVGLLAVAVLVADLYLLAGAALPVAFYAVPILIAAYLLGPPMVAAVGGLSVLLVLVGAAIEQLPFVDWFPRDVALLFVASLALALSIRTRREAEAALRANAEASRARALLEATFEGIAIHEGGRVLEVNDAFARMFGYEPSEVIGMAGLETVTPECRDAVREKIRTGYEQPYETVGLRKDGTTFPLEVHGKEMSYRGRRVRVAAVRDITERKRVEQFREEYVSLISHDLRAPLTAAMAHIQALQKKAGAGGPHGGGRERGGRAEERQANGGHDRGACGVGPAGVRRARAAPGGRRPVRGCGRCRRAGRQP